MTDIILKLLTAVAFLFFWFFFVYATARVVTIAYFQSRREFFLIMSKRSRE